MKKKLQNLLHALRSFLVEKGEKIQRTHPVVQLASFGVCAGILFLLFLGVLVGPSTRRSVFLFQERRSGKVRAEIRYLPNARTADTRFALYAGEVLLGPERQDSVPLFNRGTKLESAFLRGRDAYVALSSEALMSEPGVAPVREGCQLFEKNVCTNFRNIAKIYLYIDGIEVYSGNSDDDAKTGMKKR